MLLECISGLNSLKCHYRKAGLVSLSNPGFAKESKLWVCLTGEEFRAIYFGSRRARHGV